MNWYGFLIAIGLGACLVAAWYIARKRGYHKDALFDVLPIPLALAFIGLRLWYVIFDSIGGDGSWSFLEIIGFRNGRFVGFAGLAIWGGIIGALLGAVLVAYVIMPKFFKDPARKISFWQMADIGMGVFLLGQAIGRWGNFANQEAFGREITNSSLQWFPFAVNVNGIYYQATFFYESLWNIIGFGIFMWFLLGKRRSFDGFVLACYLIWYGTGRFFIEFLRSDAQRMWQGGPRVVQVICALAVLFGIGLILFHVYKARQTNKKPFLFVPVDQLSLEYYGYDKTRDYFNLQNKDISEEPDEYEDNYKSDDSDLSIVNDNKEEEDEEIND